MKFQLLTLTTLLALTTAQSISGEPACATSCLSYAITAAGCGINDLACQCGQPQTAIDHYIAACEPGSCTGDEFASALSIGSSRCFEYLATAVTTTTTSSSATTSGNGLATSTSSATGNATVVITTPGTATTSLVATGVGGSNTVTVASSRSPTPTTSRSPSISSSAGMALLVNGIGGLAAAFFGFIATL